MDEQENLEIGTKEAMKLKPGKVKIVSATIQPVGDKGAKKLVCEVKHQDKDETIQISSVKYEQKGKLAVSGLWVNRDDDKKIRKGSALALFLESLEAKTLEDLKDKEVQTVEDDSGYLTFKIY